MLTRRALLKTGAGLCLGAGALASYAGAIEPGYMLWTTRYRVTPDGWPADLSLKISIIADIHACEPFMGPARIARIAARAMAGAPDLILLLGDFNAGTKWISAPVQPMQWAEALSVLKAPLGVHAILGNHDWWHGPTLRSPPDGGEAIRLALAAMGARLYENDAVRMEKNGRAFWLLGLADQMVRRIARNSYRGHDDLDGTLAKIDDDAPAILMAHEPFIFDRVPDRVAVTLCGHTHGGQVNLPLLGPVVADRRYGPDRVYGHHIDGKRHLVISAGLGESYLPVRFLRPPEIVELTLGADPQAAA